MRRFKVIGLAIMAVFMLGAITAASATAASTVLPEFSPATGGTGTGATGSLNLEGTKIECTSNTSSIGGGTREGTFKITFASVNLG